MLTVCRPEIDVLVRNAFKCTDSDNLFYSGFFAQAAGCDRFRRAFVI